MVIAPVLYVCRLYVIHAHCIITVQNTYIFTEMQQQETSDCHYIVWNSFSRRLYSRIVAICRTPPKLETWKIFRMKRSKLGQNTVYFINQYAESPEYKNTPMSDQYYLNLSCFGYRFAAGQCNSFCGTVIVIVRVGRADGRKRSWSQLKNSTTVRDRLFGDLKPQTGGGGGETFASFQIAVEWLKINKNVKRSREWIWECIGWLWLSSDEQ